MSKNPFEEPKKKKRGFLGYLWLMFILFLFLLIAATVFFYFERPLVTTWVLNLYAQRLAYVMTSPECYLITEDQLYLQESKGKEKSSLKELQERILKERREKALSVFLTLVKSYQAAPEQEWYSSFVELDRLIHEIFQDQKVSPSELENFMSQVEKTVEKHKK